MRKDRFGRYLPIMTPITARALYSAASNPQSMIDNPNSARGDNPGEARTSANVASVATPAES